MVALVHTGSRLPHRAGIGAVSGHGRVEPWRHGPHVTHRAMRRSNSVRDYSRSLRIRSSLSWPPSASLGKAELWEG